jgi:Sec-independent protein translocase protein TatA
MQFIDWLIVAVFFVLIVGTRRQVWRGAIQ